ncbi:SDR family NAD(P)-dependent oxidoreductase [Nocardioides sp. MH1]|uniref:SDR family NAD(P)-dependent oxidoreductase n=1 Tax=Nocardioides sp. MH1 TaxID=3242490 RepID=UPI003522B249
MTSDTELALITGASSGIGRSLAQVFVDEGYDVVVVGQSEGVEEAAAELRASGREVLPVRADLSTAAGVEELWRAVEATGRPLAAAALNAGVVVSGPFADTDLAEHLGLVDLNVRSTVHLAKLVVDHMVLWGRGRILMTASIAAATPGPFQSTYAASKAFVHSFAEAVGYELKDTEITVTSLMPGPTDTEIFERADMEDTVIGQEPKDGPDRVARDGFDAMMAGKPHVRAGNILNKVAAEVATHLPDRIGAAVAASQVKPD